jgi:feruloyl esterase
MSASITTLCRLLIHLTGVDYGGLTYTTKHGFAAVGSNNGHNGTTGIAFANNPDVVADFAGRS